MRLPGMKTTRPLLAAVVGLIVLTIGGAQVRAATGSGGAGLFAAGRALPQVQGDARLVVRGPFVDAVVTQTFRNDLDRAVEAIYVFPLPADAAVRSMTIKTGDRTITATIAARADARRRYEDAVAAGVAAALTEQERADVFTQAVAGIEPGAEVEVELRFDFALARGRGGWELVLPLVIGPRHVPGAATGEPTRGTGSAADTDEAPDASRITPPVRGDGGGNPITVRIQLPAGVSADDVDVPSHDARVVTKKGVVTATVRDARADRDLVVRWRAAAGGAARVFAESDPGGDGAYVAVVVEAPRRAVARQPRRWLVALDLSGSIAGDALVVVREVAAGLVAAVGDEPVAVIGLDDAAGEVAWATTARDRKALAARLAAAEARGATSLLALLDAALAVATGDGATGDDVAIVLVTDGLVADDARLAARVAAADGARGRLHVVGVGAAPNRALLAELARRGGGAAVVVGAGDDVDAAVGEVVLGAAAPAAVPALDWGGLAVRDIAPAVMPALAPGRSVVIAARVDAMPGAATTVRATVGEAVLTARLGDDTRGADGLVTRRWARARVEDLVAQGGDGAEVQRLGLAHGLVTPETALVAIGEQVVVQGGVTTTVSIPVPAPAGMRWQAVFGPEGDVGAVFDGKPGADSGGATGDAVRATEDARDGDEDDAERAPQAAPAPTSGTSYDAVLMSESVHGRILSRTWSPSLSLAAGVQARDGARAAELSIEASAYRGVAARLQLGLVGSLQLAPDLDGGTDAALYASTRWLLGTPWLTVAAVEAGVGPSLDVAGIAWRLGVRVGPWRIAPVLRVDQTWALDRDAAAGEDAWRPRTSVGAGIEWTF